MRSSRSIRVWIMPAIGLLVLGSVLFARYWRIWDISAVPEPPISAELQSALPAPPPPPPWEMLDDIYDPPLRVGGGVSPPEKISGDLPFYTDVAIISRTTGVVIVEAVIDENGDVTNVRVLKGMPMGLDRVALYAVQKWKFKPAQLRGRPVKVYYMITVQFQGARGT